jgi:lipopolysaccharide export LptBFGC system permease protein LptF
MLSLMSFFLTDNILPKCEIQNKQVENEVILEGFKSQNLEVGKKVVKITIFLYLVCNV